MFGIRKRRHRDVENLKNEFESIMQQVRNSEIEKQSLVGYGILSAEKRFFQNYSVESFKTASFAEKIEQLHIIQNIEIHINGTDGPMRITSIGYGLFKNWIAVVMHGDSELIEKFDKELVYLKNISASFLPEISD